VVGKSSKTDGTFTSIGGDVSKAKVVIAIAAIALALIATGTWWFTTKPGSQPAQHAKPQTVQTQPLSQAEAQRLELALNSTDVKVQASAMVPETQAAYVASGQQMLPSGASIRFKAETFASNGNAGRVDAVITTADGNSKTYQVLLTRQGPNSPWLILTTEGK
jgi:hypothetical protein